MVARERLQRIRTFDGEEGRAIKTKDEGEGRGRERE